MSTIVVSGALANRCGNGGGAWVRLNWLLGLRRLGHDVYFLEQLPGSQRDLDSAVKFFDAVLGPFGFQERSVLVGDDGESIHGLATGVIRQVADGADLLVNLGGHLNAPSLKNRFRRKAYVDLDPGFTQVWHANGDAGPRLQEHDAYFTVGFNIGRDDCPIPTGGIRWRLIRPPIVLDAWPLATGTAERGFTTVASWRGPFGPLTLAGKTLGLKVHEFRKFLELPRRTGQAFELALDIHPDEKADLANLERHAWRLIDPRQHAGDPMRFRHFVQSSRAEFSAAQGVYVDTNSGWFSDRTAAYLASGKPAVVQDTGLSQSLPTGAGLIAFRTLEEAVVGVNAIVGDYESHSRAARAIAEQHFDSDKVLGRLLDDLWPPA